MSLSESRRFDLVVFGATSFVGRILCRHLVERQGTDGSLRWAIAGRDKGRLDEVATETGAEVERLIVDASDRAAVDDMVGATSLVVSTVGPYALYGSPLVAAVAEHGTDYCDLTGEVQWVRRMIDEHHARAVESGARVLHCCGFDSIPSDLGVIFTQQTAIEQFGEPCERIGMRVKALKGGASGGTLASVVNLIAEASDDPYVRSVLADPLALVPAGVRPPDAKGDRIGPYRDPLSGEWVAPFVMAGVNTRIVHRTHALLGHPWGASFSYDEAVLTGSGPVGAAVASGMAGGLAVGTAALAVGPLRRVLAHRVLPQPGTGPSPEAQAAGFFDLRFHGLTADGHRITTKVTGDRDPGYGSTAKMLAATALTLLDRDRALLPGGSWTPGASLGTELIDRLVADAGLGFEVVTPTTG